MEALKMESQYNAILRNVFMAFGGGGGGGSSGGGGYENPENAAKDLKDAADAAYKSNEDNCSGSVAGVASRLGYDDLNGKKAIDQVKHMEGNWETVDAKTAQDLANKGQLVVAGLINPDGDSHVTTVVPGDGKVAPDGKFYPNVEGGGSQNGRSDGTKTAGDVWPANPKKYPKYNRSLVKYYIPKKK